MPEEKKDSFTFSDKIKSSKPVASKSFGNRISSKIGSNGKPKKTLFERTKRDAPFFIAAIAALLLLPFLYKYSGQVNEEPIATPGSEESVFDPERYGFDTTTTDPDGQIAQLAGRDPLSLIKGWGTPEPDQPAYDAIPPHDGLDDGYNPPPVTESNTNNYRTNAPAATRAAFRRSATKIKELGNAGMASRGGGQLAVGPWGGSLKRAASRVGGPAGPRSGPKPVSLQPLQAAGKPSRSYFGQGAAAEARRSKDALSKGNAMQALMDAQMRPVDPGKIGGLGGTDYRGGGNGDLKHAFAYNGLKPWWWDLMAQKHMHDWMWKRNLWQKPITMLVEGLAKGLTDFFTGFLGCLISGEDDFSMGSMWGTSEGSGSPEGCKIAGGAPVDFKTYCTPERISNDPFGLCAGDAKTFKEVCKQMAAEGKRKWEWVASKGAGGNLNWIQKRMHCMGATVKGNKGKAYRELDEASGCSNLAAIDTYNATFDTNRSMDGWKVYHYVVGIESSKAANYLGRDLDEMASDPARQKMLTVFYMQEGPKFTLKDKPYLQVLKSQKYIPLFVESIALKAPKKKYSHASADTEDSVDADAIDTAQRLVFGSKGADKTVTAKGLPMSYSEFLSTFKSGTNLLALEKEIKGPNGATGTKVKYAKAGSAGKAWSIGARCEMPLARITCEDNAMHNGLPYAMIQTVQNAKDVSDTNRRRFAVFYSVQQGDNGDYPTTLPSVQEVTLFTPKAYGGDFSSGGKDVSQDVVKGWQNGPLQYFDAVSGTIKVNGKDIKKDSGQPIMIRWSVRQSDGINVGKDNRGTAYAGDKVNGTALPGREVSVAYCRYFGDAPTEANQDEKMRKIDDATEITEGATTFAARLDQVPQKPTDRVGVTEASLAVEAESAEDAKLSAQERARKQAKRAIQVESVNVLAPNAPALFTGTEDCLKENANLAVESSMAQKYMKEVKDAYNQQVQALNKSGQKLPEMDYRRQVPSVANLVDAMQIVAQSNGAIQNGKVYKAAVCKMGRLIGTVGKDISIHNKNLRNKQGNPYNNMFGAFATYIGPESSFYPTSTSSDSGEVSDKNPRFLGFNPVYTDYKYHWGMYNYFHKNTRRFDRSGFLAHVEGRASNPYPLAELSLLKGKSSVGGYAWKETPASDAEISASRFAYWAAYSPIVADDGCDQVYGDQTMTAQNAIDYVKLVCKVGLSDKPGNGAADGRRPTGTNYNKGSGKNPSEGNRDVGLGSAER